MAKRSYHKQHFVPQLYLRGFTNATGNVFCYDKKADRSHPTTTLAAAQEANFYNLPAKAFPGQPDDLQVVEKALSRMECYYAPLLGQLVTAADKGGFTRELVTEISPFIVIQYLRTKAHREAMYELLQKSGQSIVDEMTELNFPGAKPPRFVYERDYLPVIQAQMIFDEKVVLHMARPLERHIWMIGVNNTSHPLYTSDQPLVRRANIRAYGRDFVGVNDPGVEFAFPLNSKHVLLIFERTFFAHLAKHNLRAEPLEPVNVKEINRLQVLKSAQRVYCATDSFDVARETCQQHPEIRDPDRPRVKVEHTPMKELKSYTIVTALE